MKNVRNMLIGVITMLFFLTMAACSAAVGTDEENKTGDNEAGSNDSATSDNDDEEFELQLATVVNPPHPWVDAGEFFAEEVAERTDGNVKVKVHHSATLGNDEEIMDEMQLGTIDFIIGGAQNAAPYIPQYQIFGFSYLLEDMDQFEKAVAADNEITKRLQEIHEEKDLNLKLLGLSGGGTRNVSHQSKLIKTADDLDGVKMRLPGSPIESKIWSELGAVPTSLPWNEVYSGVQTGVVEAFESTFSGYEGSKLYEVAPNISLTEHLYMASHFTMSTLTEEELPAEYNQVIEEVAIEASEFSTEKGKEYDDEIVEKLKDEGVEFGEVDTESFIEVLDPLYDELAEEIEATDLLDMIRDLQ